MTRLTNQKLIRTYPKASRVDSSNYNPMLSWRHGIQMAAINVQKPGPDIFVFCNTLVYTFASNLNVWWFSAITNKDFETNQSPFLLPPFSMLENLKI